jgi:hypothetical protein
VHVCRVLHSKFFAVVILITSLFFIFFSSMLVCCCVIIVYNHDRCVFLYNDDYVFMPVWRLMNTVCGCCECVVLICALNFLFILLLFLVVV